jgi:hypothetical protein
MKICCIGFDLPEGKVKYQDERVDTLIRKLSPQKITPFYVEFTHNDYSHSDAFLVARERVWDILILDMEKLESRQERTGCWKSVWPVWNKKCHCATSPLLTPN